MAHKIGQKICLWQEEVYRETGLVTVLKEVVVTLTEIKTGVPGEFSETPTNLESLRGVGDDGKVYEKHWYYWPESQTNDFIDRWSLREDEDGDGRIVFWSPVEAVYAHNRLADHNRKHGEEHGVLRRVDKAGNAILPKGDVVHCEKHDEYHYPDSKCFRCFLEEHKKAVVTA